ncbi:hypothetical protein BJS_07067 [Bradyrhizobium japonicum SEMIA 5079]|nr:hypothetical protein BJS_07067 [Bradyrhizobium japonicum SEMIA 5079]
MDVDLGQPTAEDLMERSSIGMDTLLCLRTVRLAILIVEHPSMQRCNLPAPKNALRDHRRARVKSASYDEEELAGSIR